MGATLVYGWSTGIEVEDTALFAQLIYQTLCVAEQHRVVVFHEECRGVHDWLMTKVNFVKHNIHRLPTARVNSITGDFDVLSLEHFGCYYSRFYKFQNNPLNKLHPTYTVQPVKIGEPSRIFLTWQNERFITGNNEVRVQFVLDSDEVLPATFWKEHNRRNAVIINNFVRDMNRLTGVWRPHFGTARLAHDFQVCPDGQIVIPPPLKFKGDIATP